MYDFVCGFLSEKLIKIYNSTKIFLTCWLHIAHVSQLSSFSEIKFTLQTVNIPLNTCQHQRPSAEALIGREGLKQTAILEF